MRREYPSTPDEAFEQALEGAYFATQLAAAAKHGRIGGFPLDPRYPVNTFWDLGRNDLNTIWLHQFVKGFHRFVGYYENSGEFIGHYVRWLKEWAGERDVTFGDHYWPHDGDRESLWLEGGTMAVMEELGFRPHIVRAPEEQGGGDRHRARHLPDAASSTRRPASVGLKRLRAYRKEWDDERGVWKDRPRHDDSSHAADAFLPSPAPATSRQAVHTSGATFVGGVALQGVSLPHWISRRPRRFSSSRHRGGAEVHAPGWARDPLVSTMLNLEVLPLAHTATLRWALDFRRPS